MHYHELTEKIVSNPRNLPAYLKQRIKLIDATIAAVTAALQIIDAADSESVYLVRYAISRLRQDNPQLPDKWQLDLTRRYELESLRNNLDAMMRFGADRFLKYALGTFEHIKPLDQEARSVLALISQVDAGLQEYGFVPGQRETDPDYLAAVQLADAYGVIVKTVAAIEPMLTRLKDALLHIQKRQMYNWQPEKYRPDHNEVETLYHATMYATEIVRNGFSAEKPEGRQGVGNFGEQSLISFTHDLRIAHDIMRTLRDLWMIVHGEITRRDVFKWMHVEQIDPKQAASYFMRSDEPLDSVPQIIRLYRAYLGLSKLRTDPVLVSPEQLIPQLRERSIKDIGIVACEVRLSGDEHYLHGEAEFRVPASQIVGPVKRVV